MDIQFMKSVDRFAGYPICGGLRLFDLAAGALRPVPSAADLLEDLAGRSEEGGAGPGPRIGVIKFWGMGSLLLASPLFNALRTTHPRAEIVLITLKENRGIVELLDPADEVLYLGLEGGAPGIVGGILAHLARVKALGLDAVVDLEYLTRFSSLVSYASGAPVRVGFHSWDVWRGGLHNERRAFNPYWHVTDNFLNLARALGRDPGSPPPLDICLDGSEDREAGEILAAAGVSEDERVVAVNANASTMALARRWPEENFVELIGRVADAGLGRVVLLGAPGEAAYVESLRARTHDRERVASLAGKSSLRGLVGVLRRASLLVTNDSGPLHLAASLGARTVSFFGPETPSLYGPRGDGHVVLYRGIDCSPCINIYNAKTVRCMRGSPECLSGIGVDEAFAAVSGALED